MKKYKKHFSFYLKKINISSSTNAIISNHNSNLLYSKKDIYNSLVKQIYKKVRWSDNIKKIISLRKKIIIEIGIGRILTNLNKKNKTIQSYSTDHSKKLSLIVDIIKKL